MRTAFKTKYLGGARVAVVAAAAGALATGLLGALPSAGAGASPEPDPPNVLLVGTWHHKPGPYHSIQAAVNAAKPGDWILVGPGDYRESPGSEDGVRVTTPNLHIRGMERNAVVVDGTLPGHSRCDSAPSVQNLGQGSAGRNGIEVFESNGDSVENLTVCNFLSGSSGEGNEVWFNGGDGTGKQNLGSFHGAYLTATSTFVGPSNTAQYGLFVSNSHGPGEIVNSFGSNMADAAYYVGACPDCNVVLDRDKGVHNVLGYSGTNAGGHLIIQRSIFANNKTGIVPNSLNNDDAPPPQNGACPNGGIGPLGTGSCTVIENNLVVGNNNPNVPGGGDSGTQSVIGAGIVVAGGQNDAVSHNLVADNGSWGILVTDNPYVGTPPPVSHCEGGISLAPSLCYFQAYGNAVRDNLLARNGFFKNPTNGDLAEATIAHNPGNCWFGNAERAVGHHVTTDPANIQTIQGTCGQPNRGDIIGPLGVELACATQALGSCSSGGEAAVVQEIILLASLLGVSPAPLQKPGIDQLPVNYPLITQATAPFPPHQPSMKHPCQGVPANPWCE